MNIIIVDYYNLGAAYSRKILSKGRVCIFVHKSINYPNSNYGTFCIDQVTEICATKHQSAGQNICMVAIYRAPSGLFYNF